MDETARTTPAPTPFELEPGPDPGLHPTVPAKQAALAFLIALALVAATRWPVARAEPIESDEYIFVRIAGESWFDPYHTLYNVAARLTAGLVGDRFLAFIAVNVVSSALALVAVWWWLRAVVRPATAAAAAVLLGLAPLFWAYGAAAGNYTMIAAVGAFLLGAAARSGADARAWHPFAAAAVLAFGAGYRHDIGTFWLPVFGVVLWRHRWRVGLAALGLFTALNLAWVVPMLAEAGGWHAYRAATADFAYNAGYLNSVWNLGLVDAPARYAVKLMMALLWTFGPALLLAPRGAARLARGGRPWLLALLALSVAPALALHLLVHFGVPGYAMHYAPALVALVALGAGRRGNFEGEAPTRIPSPDLAPARLAALAGLLAAAFWFYPTDFERPGFRGDFDLAFARQTRIGLRTRPPVKTPSAWRTNNSRPADPRTARR